MALGTDPLDAALTQRRLWRPASGNKARWTWCSESWLTDVDSSNLVLYSQEIDNAAWIKSIGVTANAGIAPDGSLTADNLTQSGGGGGQYVVQNVTLVADWVAWSAYIRRDTASFLHIVVETGGAGTNIWYDLINRRFATVAAGVDVALQPYVVNGWDRIFITKNHTSSSGNSILFRPANADGGFNANDLDSYDLWGVQGELGVRTASLYRPTTGSVITGSTPTWLDDKARGIVSWRSDKRGQNLAATHPYRNMPPLIGA
jgi:hypothetical protein